MVYTKKFGLLLHQRRSYPPDGKTKDSLCCRKVCGKKNVCLCESEHMRSEMTGEVILSEGDVQERWNLRGICLECTKKNRRFLSEVGFYGC